MSLKVEFLLLWQRTFFMLHNFHRGRYIQVVLWIFIATVIDIKKVASMYSAWALYMIFINC